MPGLQPYKKVIYFSNEEKESKVYEYIDKLIVLFPSFDYFRPFDFYKVIEPVFKSPKIRSVDSEIQIMLKRLGYIEHPPGGNAVYILTEKGRLVKEKGGHFKYLKSLEPKKDWFKIIPIILSIVFGISMAIIGVLNYKLNRDKDKSSIEKEQLNKQIDSLKEKIKILENKRGLN